MSENTNKNQRHMKVILSRKGFDSANGGCASPILHPADDTGIALSDRCTLLSLPIPDEIGIEYTKLRVPESSGISYADLISQLKGHDFPPATGKRMAHLDPDIRKDNREEKDIAWDPAFGQTKAAATFLKNNHVEKGDLFLFFGWFRNTTHTENGYRFVRKRDADRFFEYADMQIIYGYLQIEQILQDKKDISSYEWHPHAMGKYIDQENNTLFLPSQILETGISDIDRLKLPGYKAFNFRPSLILTQEGRSRGTWTDRPCYRPENVVSADPTKPRKNSAKGSGIYYKGIWQELILKDTSDNPGLKDWLVGIFKDEAVTPD